MPTRRSTGASPSAVSVTPTSTTPPQARFPRSAGTPMGDPSGGVVPSAVHGAAASSSSVAPVLPSKTIDEPTGVRASKLTRTHATPPRPRHVVKTWLQVPTPGVSASVMHSPSGSQSATPAPFSGSNGSSQSRPTQFSSQSTLQSPQADCTPSSVSPSQSSSTSSQTSSRGTTWPSQADQTPSRHSRTPPVQTPTPRVPGGPP